MPQIELNIVLSFPPPRLLQLRVNLLVQALPESQPWTPPAKVFLSCHLFTTFGQHHLIAFMKLTATMTQLIKVQTWGATREWFLG